MRLPRARIRNGQLRRDERGSALIFALMFIIIVAIAGVAVLNQVQAGPNAQHAYATVRTQEITVDGAADAATQAIRYNPSAGASPSLGLSGPCSSGGYTQLPNMSFVEPNNQSLTAWCRPDDSSEGFLGSAGDAPPYTLLSLGGMVGRGNYQAATNLGASAAAQLTLTGNQWTKGELDNPSDNYPFCDDWETGDSTTCEAGIYIGRAVSSGDTDGGGLHISGNGSLTPATYPVRSNSSIVVNTNDLPPDQQNTRNLTVDGNIYARRACGAFKGTLAAGIDIVADDGGTTSCDPLSNFTNANANFTSTSLVADPLFVHEPIDVAQLPRVDDDPSTPTQYQLSTSLCADGYVEMPALKIGKEDGADVYGAWYDSAAALNALMNSSACDDTLFYFRPGVYYFDFLDKSTSGPVKWLAPTGCYPITGSCATGTSEIVGGTPPANVWTPGQPESANATSNTTQQPDKVMSTNINSTGGNWLSPEQSVGIDGDLAESALCGGGSGCRSNAGSSQLTQHELQTPMPELANHIDSISSVKFEIAYKMTDKNDTQNSALWAPSGTANNPTSKPGGQLQITLPGTGGGVCYMQVPDGDYSKLKTGDDHRVDPNTANENIDLSQGCPYTDSRFEKASGIFAPGAGSCDARNPSACAGAFMANTGGAGWNAHQLNQVTASITAWASSAATATAPADFQVDGMQFVVSYKGRPSPPFPNGCDRSKPGVQFIFGDNARIDWGGGGRDFFSELCASAQNRFPNWDNDLNCAPDTYKGPITDPTKIDENLPCGMTGAGNDYNIALYGLSEGTSPSIAPNCNQAADGTVPSCVLNTNVLAAPSTPTACGTAPSYGATVCTDMTQGQTTGAFNSNPPSPATYMKIDGTAATATWTGQGDPSLAFKLPSLVCPYASYTDAGGYSHTGYPRCPANTIPWGSEITNVQMTIKHREGDIVGGVFTPTSGASSSGQITGVEVSVTPGDGSNTTGSNSYSSTSFDTNTQAGLNNNTGLPLCQNGTSYCSYTFGDPSGNPVDTDASQTANDAVNQFNFGANWSMQRTLTKALGTPEAIGGGSPGWDGNSASGQYTGSNGAEIEVTFHTGSGTDTNQHEADLDGIEFQITYRATGNLRPLRGCLTTRTEWAPGMLVPSASGNATGTVAATGYDWLDADWGINNAKSDGTPLAPDNPYVNYTKSQNLSPVSDSGGCALLAIDNSSPGKKLHVQGLLYAPSAAFSLSGVDNDASWATDGIYARQITAFRWNQGGDIPAIGGSSPPKNNRKVTIEIHDSSGKVLLRRVVTFDDDNFQRDQFGVPHVGKSVTVVSDVRNPTS